MKLIQRIPPSRRGKKQVIAYVEPDIADAVRDKAYRESKTIQEIVAEAMNLVLERNNKEPIFATGHDRIVRRSKGIAKTRTSLNAPRCRTGRRPIGGWFNENTVQRAVAYSDELEQPIQQLLESGLKALLRQE